MDSDQLFDFDFSREDSREWNQEIVRRAYSDHENAPFDRIRNYLDNGYSVLVYLPGNCMTAAANYINNPSHGGREWEEFGQYTKQGASDNYEQMWNDTRNVISTLM